MQAATFNQQKNLKAIVYTIVVCGLVVFLFFYFRWNLPQTPPPIEEMGIEVNLGNSETGLGDIAPQVPDEPSNATETNMSAPPPTVPENISAVPPINADENGDEEINTATKNIKPEKPKATLTPTTANKKTITKKAATVKTPTTAAPKAVYTGGTGAGGNGADSYNNVKNQGIAGGQGDQGKPNGDPNSTNYAGAGGISIRSGLAGRRFRTWPSFEDKFNEPAKVAVDVTVDAAGNVTNATINPHGTTTTNSNIRSISIRKAKLLKFNEGSEEQQIGTIVFNFKLRG
jgi:hypothetical protein